MTTSKLLDKLRKLLDAEHKAQKAHYDALKNILQSLREKKKKLKAEMAQCDDELTRAEIRSRLNVISKQRKKGMRLLKDLKQERKQHHRPEADDDKKG